MRRGLAAAVVIAVTGLELLLAAGRLQALPEMARLALAFAALVLLPGAALVFLLVRHEADRRAAGEAAREGAAAPPRTIDFRLFAPVCALGFGVAWNGLAILVGLAFHVRLDAVRAALPGVNLLLGVLALARAPRGARAGSAPGEGRVAGLPLAIVLLAAALAAIHAGRTGTPESYFSDSPDHIGTIRRIVETGNPFPTDAFFRDAGPEGADPRKGLWHPQVAMIASVAHVDPEPAWRQLPALIAPFFLLNLAFLGALSGGAPSAAVFAVVQLVVLIGASNWFPLRKAGFATFLADELSMAAVFAVLADTVRPSRALRAAALGIALGAVFVHVYSAIQLAMTLGALAAGLALRERRLQGPVFRTIGTGLAIGLLALPYLLWRTRQAYAPANVIHTASQGLLWLGDSMRVVSIGVLWDWMGILWVLVPLAAWTLWRHGRHDPAALYVLTTSLAVALVMFDPPAVAILEPRVGYLLMRMVWMVPIGALIAWLLVFLAGRLRGPGPGRRRAGAALAAVVLVCLPTVRDALATLARPAALAAIDREQSPLRWRAALAWMDRHLPAGQVVLADPATSYGVPMLTRHHVVTLIDQHSSPSDAHALERILEARDALDPWASWARTREVLVKRGVTAIVVNSDFPEPPPSDYWAASPEWAAAARARLDRRPAAFERVYDRNGFTVYRVHRAALDTLDGAPPARPFVVPYAAGRFPIGRRYAEDLPVIHRLSLWPQRIARGDTLRGVAEWRALSPMPAGSYLVSVRFDQPLPGGFRPPAALAKPARKVLEKLEHRRFRFRADHLPTSGAYGVDLWKPDEVVRDSFQLVVPADAAPGYYRAEIRMNRSPHYPNFHLSDYFFDRDYFSGVAMTAIEVTATRADLARPPAPLPDEFGETH